MPRPRKPLAKALLDGSAAHNPQRFRHRREPTSAPLGPPPGHLSADARRVWRDLARRWPWMTDSDGPLLEVLCELTARFRKEPPAPGSVLAKEHRMIIAAFGGTPMTRGNVSTPAPEEGADDPFSQF